MSFPPDLAEQVATEYKKELQWKGSGSDAVLFIPSEALTGLCQTHRIGPRTLVHKLAEAKNMGALTWDQLEPLVLQREEKSFPTKRSERFEAALKTTNMEERIAAMLVLDGNLHTAHELRAKLIKLVGEDTPIQKGPTMASYYDLVLYEAGFVTKLRLGKGLGLNQLYVTLSEDGRDFGQPLHYHALRQLNGHKQSVRQFGFANDSSGHSGVYNRYQILKKLQEAHDYRPTTKQEKMEDLQRQLRREGPRGVRISTLTSSLKIHRESVEAHLKQLKDQGYVTVNDGSAWWTGPERDFMVSFGHAVYRFVTEPEVRRQAQKDLASDPTLPNRIRQALEASHQYTRRHDPLPFDEWKQKMLDYLRTNMNGHQGLPRGQVIAALPGLPHTHSQRMDRLVQLGLVEKFEQHEKGCRIYYRPMDVTI